MGQRLAKFLLTVKSKIATVPPLNVSSKSPLYIFKWFCIVGIGSKS